MKNRKQRLQKYKSWRNHDKKNISTNLTCYDPETFKKVSKKNIIFTLNNTLIFLDKISMNAIFQNLKKIAKSPRESRVFAITNILDEINVRYKIENDNNLTNIHISYNGKKTKKLILIAHHDIAKGTFQGANDNTASVAVLISVADWLKTHMSEYSVEIGLVDNEEYLGALFAKNISKEDKLRIAVSIGSYIFLKQFRPDDVKCVLNFEMSGIGSGIFLASSSGNIPCTPWLNNKLESLASLSGIPCSRLSISNSDLLSAYIHKMPATVIGALPRSEMINHNGILIPHEWATMHTPQDTADKIDENSLTMMEIFIRNVINSQI